MPIGLEMDNWMKCPVGGADLVRAQLRTRRKPRPESVICRCDRVSGQDIGAYAPGPDRHSMSRAAISVPQPSQTTFGLHRDPQVL